MKIKTITKYITAITLALLTGIGGIYLGGVEVYAASGNLPTIRMGDNAPMTRDEFMEWRDQKGVRHLSIEERIYPAGLFFEWNVGRVFRYGALNDRILNVYLVPGAVSQQRSLSSQGTIAAQTPPPQYQNPALPVIFEDLTPILFTDEQLSAMIERVPNAGPLEARSAITLPNRRLTDAELEAWIYEYSYMGGVTAFELGVIREVNRVRERYGLNPLYLCPALMLAARFKTQEFGDLQYFGHRSPVYGTPSEFVRMFDFTGSVSEAITQSGSNSAPVLRTTPERVVSGMLLSSRGHREILLNPNLNRVGFGAFFSPNSTGARSDMTHMFYFATMFGRTIN